MDKNRKLFDSKIGCQGFINMQIEEHNNIIWEQGMEKLKALSASQKKEADRLIKQNLSKELDERLKSNLQKTFLFLFGRQGQDSLSKFIRDKTVMTYYPSLWLINFRFMNRMLKEKPRKRT